VESWFNDQRSSSCDLKLSLLSSQSVTVSAYMPSRSLRVAFIHPDLGIGAFCQTRNPNNSLMWFSGGAERLVVDAALGIQSLGHSVDIYTSHHNPAHCFDETRDGTSSCCKQNSGD
jgi:hypothetical protein